MKKMFAFAAMFAAVAMVACGGQQTAAEQVEAAVEAAAEATEAAVEAAEAVVENAAE